MATDYSPLQIPQVGRDQFLLQNRLFGQSRQISVVLGQQTLTLALQSLDAGLADHAGTRLVLSTGAHTLTILVSRLTGFHTLSQLLGDAEPQLIPESILKAMVEVCFQPALNWLRDALGMSLELQSVDLEVPWQVQDTEATAFQFEFSDGDDFQSLVWLSVPAELTDLANSLLERMPVVGCRSLQDVVIPLTAVSGSVEVELEDFSSLRRDDLLILDTFAPEDSPWALVAGGCQVGRAQLDGGSLVLIDVAQQPFPSRRRVLTGGNSASGKSTVNLDVVQAQGAVRLEELPGLQPQSRIAVQTLANDGVTLWNAAQAIGYGSLVSLGNGVAVRIVSFDPPENPSGHVAA